jgi:hypothetical protein
MWWTVSTTRSIVEGMGVKVKSRSGVMRRRLWHESQPHSKRRRGRWSQCEYNNPRGEGQSGLIHRASYSYPFTIMPSTHSTHNDDIYCRNSSLEEDGEGVVVREPFGRVCRHHCLKGYNTSEYSRKVINRGKCC